MATGNVTPRARILTALRGSQPDRMPIFEATTPFMRESHNQLCAFVAAGMTDGRDD